MPSSRDCSSTLLQGLRRNDQLYKDVRVDSWMSRVWVDWKVACTVAAGAVQAALPYQRHHILLRAALLHKLCILCKERLHGQAVTITDLHEIRPFSLP